MTQKYAGYETMEFDRDAGILTVTLNRPDKLNAVNAAMHTELASVFRDIADDDDVDVVIITGRGRAFSAGGDLDDTPKEAGPGLDRLTTEGRRLIIDLLELPQPIIAAVNGPAVGLGATISLFCDITILAEDAIISDPHVVVGVTAGDGGAAIWPWLVGMKRAKEFLLTGDRVSAEAAEAMGLANRVVGTDELLTEAKAFAARLARLGRRGVRGTKAALNTTLRSTVNETLDQSLAYEKECFVTGDHDRAVKQFRASSGK
jgi:enoyl-CoA hydratase